MPYAFETNHILLTEAEDSRRKIPTEKYDEIRSRYKDGEAIRAIARHFKVDKRLIQFILFPERQITARANRNWRCYYKGGSEWAAIMRKYRQEKQKKLKLRITYSI